MKRTVLFSILALSTPAFAAPKAVPHKAKPVAAAQRENVVNINEASADQLKLLPGVGATVVEELLAHRTKAPLKCDGLASRVYGISAKKEAALKPFCTESGPTTLTVKMNKDGQPSKTKATTKKERLAGNQ